MAKAVAKPKTTRKIVLTLSEAEAQTLQAVLCHVGGYKDLSPRKHTQAMWNALIPLVGEAYSNDTDNPAAVVAHGTVRFDNYLPF